MIRRNEPPKVYAIVSEIPSSNEKVLHLRLDRESFDALKELLRKSSTTQIQTFKEAHSTRGCLESPSSRRTRESLKRVFDQIRDMYYDDKTPLTGLDYE